MRGIVPNPPPEYETREEYLLKLNKWLAEAKLWHSICSGVPYYLANMNSSQMPTFQAFLNNNNAQNARNVQDQYYVYKVPPVWKRIAAELLDFCLLLVAKVFMSFVVLQVFQIDIEEYALNYYKKLQNPKNALRISFELLVLEVVYRLFVCFYEAYWTSSYPCATPGKKYMGLQVLYVERVISIPGGPEDTVRASPCSPLGFLRALNRAFFKNILVGLILPICFVVLFFKHNRTGYDVVSYSLVVENDTTRRD